MTTSARGVETSFDLYDKELMQDPHRVYDEFRTHCPVAHSDRTEGFWVLSRYEDVVAANLDTSTFSSRFCLLPRMQFGPDFTERPPLTLDPPEHTAFRRLLLPGFTAKQVAKWEPDIRRICREALAEFAATGSCDATSDYAKKIPLGFTCQLLGVPPEMEPDFARWSFGLVEADDVEGALKAAGEIAAFLHGQVEQRRTAPTDDLISVLMDIEIEGERLDGPQLLGALVLILIAGLDTTWSAIGSSLYHLASHPEDRRRLVKDPSLIPSAVEELLRYETSVHPTRTVTRPCELGGVELSPGDRIAVPYGASNRDPTVFERPDEIVLDRAANRHLAFGAGNHRCLGSHLARLELRVAFEEIFRRVPSFSVPRDAVLRAYGGQTRAIANLPFRIDT